MNPVMSFVAIVSLLLGMAVAGSLSKEQAENSAAAGQINPSKIVLNHNETMVIDAALVQSADSWSLWLLRMERSIVTTFFSDSPTRKGGCDEWGCGTNHNETMVSDTSR